MGNDKGVAWGSALRWPFGPKKGALAYRVPQVHRLTYATLRKCRASSPIKYAPSFSVPPWTPWHIHIRLQPADALWTHPSHASKTGFSWF